MKYLPTYPPLGALILTVLLLSLGGCASISVKPGTSTATSRMPDKVFVENFDVAHGSWKVDRTGAELQTFKNNLQAMMATAIKVDLTTRLVPAEPVPADFAMTPQNAWVIRGEFTRVEQGSRLLRGAIGFGAGATKLETHIYVYNLAQDPTTPFLDFFTTGGSNAEPGAVTALSTDPLTIAVEAVAGGAGNIAHGLTEDTKRTARENTAELSDYMYKSGWISKDKWIPPKQYTP